MRRADVASPLIHPTGNPVVDALRWMAPRCTDRPLGKLIGREAMNRRLLLVTCHRRENLGAPMRAVARGIATLAQNNPDLVVLFPVHPNPPARAAITPSLQRISNVILCEPLDYDQFLSCLQHAFRVISDSGGVQEEATALGKPVLVLRQETERPEGVAAGALKLIGTDSRKIVQEAERLLNDHAVYRRMSQASNVFGDGHAAERIVRILERSLVHK